MEDALYPVEDALQLVAKFQDCSLDLFDWTHEAHVVVCLYYLSMYSPTEALPLVRTAISTYNVKQGKGNSDTMGYHETMTVFWLFHIQKSCAKNGKVAFDQDTIDDMLWDETIVSRNVWLAYYSKERMMSTEARLQFVAPDLKALV
jgi:hypothetical protein